MNQKIKVAMIGGGVNSAIGRTHEIAMKMDNRFQLVAGCFSRDAAVNARSGAEYSVESHRVYGTAEALLKAEKDQIDAVVIALPISEHERNINMVIDQGLTVICDKPLLANINQCHHILDKVSQDSSRVFSIFNYTGYPAVREIKRRVAAGEIGDVFKIMAEMPQDSYLRLKNQRKTDSIQTWRLVDEAVSCLSLDLFTHLHSLVSFIANGKPLQVSACARAISQVSPELLDEVDAIIQYENNLVVNVWYGKVALGYRNGLRMRIFGTKGSLEWHQEEPETIRHANAVGDRIMIDRISTTSQITTEARYNRFKAGHPSGFLEAFANYYWDVARAITEGRINEYTLSVGTAIEGIVLCHAIEKSARERRMIMFEEAYVKS